jgi:hypothetical protein
MYLVFAGSAQVPLGRWTVASPKYDLPPALAGSPCYVTLAMSISRHLS